MNILTRSMTRSMSKAAKKATTKAKSSSAAKASKKRSASKATTLPPTTSTRADRYYRFSTRHLRRSRRIQKLPPLVVKARKATSTSAGVSNTPPPASTTNAPTSPPPAPANIVYKTLRTRVVPHSEEPPRKKAKTSSTGKYIASAPLPPTSSSSTTALPSNNNNKKRSFNNDSNIICKKRSTPPPPSSTPPRRKSRRIEKLHQQQPRQQQQSREEVKRIKWDQTTLEPGTTDKPFILEANNNPDRDYQHNLNEAIKHIVPNATELDKQGDKQEVYHARGPFSRQAVESFKFVTHSWIQHCNNSRGAKHRYHGLRNAENKDNTTLTHDDGQRYAAIMVLDGSQHWRVGPPLSPTYYDKHIIENILKPLPNPDQTRHYEFDPFQAEPEVWEMLKGKGWMDIHVTKGEAVFIPPHWIHCVYSIPNTVRVNMQVAGVRGL